MEKFKSVSDILKGDLTEEKEKKPRGGRKPADANAFSDDDMARIAPILRLSSLEQAWPDIVGDAVAKRTAPAACRFEDEGMVLTVHVEDPSLLHSIMFRKSQMTASVRRFFKRRDVTLEIKTGKIPHRSSAKPPLPVYKRRAPVVIPEDQVEEEARRLGAGAETDADKELAVAVARLKLTFERILSRKN